MGTTMAGEGVIVRVDIVGAEIGAEVVTAVIVIAEFFESAPKSDGLALAAEAVARENSPMEADTQLAGVDDTATGSGLRVGNELVRTLGFSEEGTLIVLLTVESEAPEERLEVVGAAKGSVLTAVATEKLGRIEAAVTGSDLMAVGSEMPNKPLLVPNREG